MIHLVNLVFILAFLAFAHFVDGKVTRTLKAELREVENEKRKGS